MRGVGAVPLSIISYSKHASVQHQKSAERLRIDDKAMTPYGSSDTYQQQNLVLRQIKQSASSVLLAHGQR